MQKSQPSRSGTGWHIKQPHLAKHQDLLSSFRILIREEPEMCPELTQTPRWPHSSATTTHKPHHLKLHRGLCWQLSIFNRHMAQQAVAPGTCSSPTDTIPFLSFPGVNQFTVAGSPQACQPLSTGPELHRQRLLSVPETPSVNISSCIFSLGVIVPTMPEWSKDHNTIRKLKSLYIANVGGEARVLQLNCNCVWNPSTAQAQSSLCSSLPQRIA